MIAPAHALAAIPVGLRNPLVGCFNDIARNFAEHRWEPAELNGGKFCEVVYTILEGALSGSFAGKPSKPAKMVDACRALEENMPDIRVVCFDRTAQAKEFLDKGIISVVIDQYAVYQGTRPLEILFDYQVLGVRPTEEKIYTRTEINIAESL